MLFIETLAGVKKWLKTGAKDPATIQALDLVSLDAKFASVRFKGCIFLGCRIGNVLDKKIRNSGAGWVSELSVLPKSLPAFDPGIYTVAELYAGLAEDGSGWERTPD